MPDTSASQQEHLVHWSSDKLFDGTASSPGLNRASWTETLHCRRLVHGWQGKWGSISASAESPYGKWMYVMRTMLLSTTHTSLAVKALGRPATGGVQQWQKRAWLAARVSCIWHKKKKKYRRRCPAIIISAHLAHLGTNAHSLPS